MPVADGTTQAHRRRGQRHRRGGRRPRLPDQGCVHARRALPRHGSARRRLQRDPPALGSATAASAARCRCGCSETRREADRDRRRHARASAGPWPGGWRRAAIALALLGRNAADLAASAGDLAARAPGGVGRRDGDDPVRPGPAGDLRGGARRGGASRSAGLDAVRDHRRRLRYAGGARGRRGGARARALDQLHAHDPVLRGGARAPARAPAAARCACSGRSPAIAPASRSCSMARPRRAWRITSRAWTCAIATPGCASCWSSRGSSAPA